jgi:UDP-3-O-[3-hydroxymyristoyl] N-acetylglucosamine deacetylase
MRDLGLALGGSLNNAIVIGEEGILNDEKLRFKDEFARHKMLDFIGDIFLVGGFIQGHFKAVKSGHKINNQLLRKLFADKDAYRFV